MSGWAEGPRRLMGAGRGYETSERRVLEQLFAQRYVAIGALVAALFIVPGVPNALVAATLAVGLGVNGAAHLQSRRIGRVPMWLPVADLAGCLTFPVLFPAAFLPCALLLLSIVCLVAILRGMGAAAAMALVAVVGLTVLEVTIGFPQGHLVIIGFGVASVTIGMGVSLLSQEEVELRRQLDAVVNNMDAALWVRDPEVDQVSFVNKRTLAMLGWTEASWLEPGFWTANVHPDDLTTARDAMAQVAGLGIDQQVQYRFRTADGHWVDLQDRISSEAGPDGKVVALQSTCVDVSERVRIEQRLKQYADIVDRIDLALLVLRLEDGPSATLRMTAANPAAGRPVDRDLLPLVGNTLEEAFPALAGSRLRTRLATVVERAIPLRVDDLLVRPSGGETKVVTLRAFPLPDRALGVSLQDVTDTVAASEALRRQALYDSLTGLPNRRLLDDELHRVLGNSPIPGQAIALLVMDLDQFKEVNDALGHHVGDQLLRGIGDRLTTELADSLVARLGGDEFAVVLSGILDEEDARAVADRIRKILAEPFTVEDVRLQSNASIGIALFPTHARDVSTLVQRADVAMYMAKRAGTGVAVYSADQDRSSVERLNLIGDLPGAAEAGQFDLHYQPCINLRTGQTVRVEALIRWNHPRFGVLPPDRFIELAELSGAIQPLTRWVIREGLRAADAWHAAGHELGLAMNLSVRNLYDPELIPTLESALENHRLDPGDLILELTETELMDDPSLAREVFTALGDLGISTSIDDFGTGYSSLTYLRDLPLQEIKIDRSFVSEMHRRSDEFTIVRSMIDLGHNLGLEVVAEGVEHRDDLQLLRRLGCDLAQGFHFSKPLPLDELLVWLTSDPLTEQPETRPM